MANFGDGCPLVNEQQECATVYIRRQLEPGAGQDYEYTYINSATSSILLENGEYTLVAEFGIDNNDFYDFFVGITWEKLKESSATTRYGGGLRIKKLTIGDGVNTDNNIVKTYSYTTGVGSDTSSGSTFSTYPPFYTKTLETTYGGGCTDSYFIISPSPVGRLVSSSGSFVGYKTVQEELNGNGLILYKFDFVKDESILYAESIPSANLSAFRGNPIKIEYYKKEGEGFTLQKRVNKKYLETKNLRSFGHKSTDEVRHGGTNYSRGGIFYTYGLYSTRSSLEQSEETIYFQENNSTDSVKNVTRYFYGNPNHLQLTKTTVNNSKGVEIVTTMEYAADFEGTEFGSDKLRANHMHSQVLRQMVKQKKGSIETALSKSETTYAAPFDDASTSEETEGPIVPILIKSYPSLAAEPTEVNMVYDEVGNVVQTNRSGDILTSYLWSYNNSYPVAKITGTDIATIKGILGEAFITALGSATLQTDIEAKIAQLRNNLYSSSSIGKDIQISTFVYKPLVGMTSQTDQNGITTYYHYDEFGRLEYVEDHEGNILQSNEYHYSTDGQ
ncbi:hypothetical protein R9C00_04725 [Flammeovirgaceae bacterium SG7u.111]|nr:hypothetical protein [Flammeovirgaceae bacterium SG7u.132]WPO36747.1 hypothetical protein R9C00_04725 [Flammeovirgaceae bacterium SG7u.111]